jgi:hypothetical protein
MSTDIPYALPQDDPTDDTSVVLVCSMKYLSVWYSLLLVPKVLLLLAGVYLA